MKKYAGKQVWVQFNNTQPWFVVKADVTDEADGPHPPPTLAPIKDPQTGELTPKLLPWVQGQVTEDGALLIETGNGGKIAVELNANVVHSVAVVVEPASRIAQPEGLTSITPN